MNKRNLIWVCKSEELAEGIYYTVPVSYAGEPSSVIVFEFEGQTLAYRNLCVHMPRRLDCEKATIFDDSGKHLRCSMHGINYDPLTGVSISTICNGECLTPVRIHLDDEGVWLNDKRAKPPVD